jgi:hypothetical protein
MELAGGVVLSSLFADICIPVLSLVPPFPFVFHLQTRDGIFDCSFLGLLVPFLEDR